ncbi:MAG: hypothetical protein Q7S21_03290 [archaeon]|nr:hypothetical protein [archaeon]
MVKPKIARRQARKVSMISDFRKMKLGQRLVGRSDSIIRESLKLVRGGARISKEGHLRPTKKQIESIRLGYERFKKQKVSLFSKIGALRYADELTRSGDHWDAGTIRALAGDKPGALRSADELTRVGNHWDAGKIRALAVIENLSKTPVQKISLKIDILL